MAVRTPREVREVVAESVGRLGEGLRVRLLAVGGMLVAVLAAFAAGGGVPWPVPVLFVAAAGVAVGLPDGHFGLAVLLAFGLFWLVHVDDRATAWSMLAAAGLLLVHVAVAAAALGPAEVDLPPSLITTWARRSALAGSAAVLVWVVAAIVRAIDGGPNLVLTAAALAVVAGGAWLALARSRS